MRPWAAPLLVLLVLLVTVAGCGGSDGTSTQSHVDVDTPALRTLKHKAGISDCPAAGGPAVSDGLGEVTLPCLGGGRSVAMDRLRGPLVVNLWAQWCPPCRAELPHYEEFARRYAGKVAVLGVDWRDTQPRLALQLARKTGVTYPLVADVAGKVRAVSNSLPNLVLIDASGKVVDHEAVQIHSVAELEQRVHRYLGIPIERGGR